MRIPILVLCLVVIYGTSKVYCEENINLIESITNDGDYSTVALEKSLSRQKRCDPLSSPIVKLGLGMLGIGDTKIIKDITDLLDFINGLVNEQRNVCPKIEKFSFKLIQHAALHPIRTTKTVLCYVFNIIGNQGRVILRRSFKIFSDFLRRVFLPGLHNILNLLKNTLPLPPSIIAMITAFNILYSLLKLLGYVQ